MSTVTENNIARCYLYNEGNESKKIELTDQRLMIFLGKKRYEWPLEIVKRIGIYQRRLLVPIVFSGVFTPLVVVGFFKSYFHPVLALTFMITGIVMFYIGWIGQSVLTIEALSGHQRDIPLRNVTENVREFTAFFNHYVSNDAPIKRALFTFVGKDKEPDKILEELNRIKGEKFFYSSEQIKQKILDPGGADKMILIIDPLKKGINVNYIKSQDGGDLHPVVTSEIKEESVIGVFKGASLKELL